MNNSTETEGFPIYTSIPLAAEFAVPADTAFE